MATLPILYKSPLVRSMFISAYVASRYLSGKTKLLVYNYLQPPDVGEAKYRSHSKIPRFEVHNVLSPEPFECEKRPVRIFERILPGQLKALKLFTHSHLKLEEIYSEFELNLDDLQCHGKNEINHLINGPFPMELSPVKGHPNILECELNFSTLSKNDRCKLPDVRVRFQKNKTGLKFHDILIKDRHHGSHHYTPNPPNEHWRMAKSILLGCWSYLGEIYHHVLHGHIEVEQYAIAAHKNLNKENPLLKLLLPHLAGIGPVNVIADNTLIGKSGIFTGKGLLHPSAIDTFLYHEMQKIDWKTWTPMKPLGKWHHYAALAQLYWEMLTETTERYFKCYEHEIMEHIADINNFSKDLMRHAIKKYPNKKEKAISQVMDDNFEGLIDNLKILSRYLLFKTTFAHSWVHLMRGDIPYNHRQRFFENPADYFADQESQEVLTSMVNQYAVEYSARKLTRSCMGDDYPSILRGHDDYGISDIFKSSLEKYRDKFSEHEFNIDFIMSGIH